jgi:hypothetical protein
MKNIYIAIIVTVTMLSACDDFMDVHKEYLEGGEIMYAPKVASLEVRSGKNRAQMKCWLYNAVFVESLHISWNSGKNSLVVPVSLHSGLDSVEFIIPDLPENAYTFDVQTRDTRGVWSLFSTGLGSAYGDIFQSNVSGRSVKSAIMDGTDGVVVWNTADETLFTVETKYVTTAGDEVIVRNGKSDSTVCKSVNPSVGFSHRSLYLPEPTAIDTFYTEWSDYQKIPELIDRSEWELIEVTTERAQDGYAATNILDGNPATFWHMDWDSTLPLPYFITIDMKRNISVNAVELYRRQNSTATRSFRLHLSKDNVTYTALGDYTFTGPVMLCSFNDLPTGRYLKLEVYDTDNTAAALAELYVIGTLAGVD